MEKLTIFALAWYEWYPALSQDFALAVHAGNEVRFTVNVTGPNSGTAVVNNLSAGFKDTATFTNQPAALCEQDAEWIVGDFTAGGSLVPFADFGVVEFALAQATKWTDEVVDPKDADAQVVDIVLDGTVFAKTSVGDSGVTVQYTQ